MASRPNRERRHGMACRSCKVRKLACDKVRPSCGRCVENSRTVCERYPFDVQGCLSAGQCVYEADRQQARTDFTFVNETPGSISGQEEAASSSRAGPAREQAIPNVEISASRLAEIESRLEALTAAVRSTRSPEDAPTLPPISQGKGPEPISNDAPAVSELVEDTVAAGMDRLSLLGNGRARYITGSFWANICDEASAIDEILRDQTRFVGAAAASDAHPFDSPAETSSSGSESVQTISAIRHEMYPFGDILTTLEEWDTGPLASSRYQRSMPDLLARLPTKEFCDILFNSFILYYHAVAPMNYIPALQKDYDAFWNSHTGAGESRKATFAPLLVALIFAGAATCEESIIKKFRGQPRYEFVKELHMLAARTLRYSNFPRTPTIESFSAYMLVQNPCMKEEQPLTCCSYVGTAIRVAQMLGCNQDPSQYPSLSPIEIEVRRRVSWQVYYLDVMVALAAGLPPLIDKPCPVLPVSELKEEYIGTPEGMAYDEAVRSGQRAPERVTENSLVSASGVFIAAKYHQAVVTQSMMKKLYGNRPVTGRVFVEIRQELADLRVDMSARLDRLPPHSPGNDINPAQSFTRWARLLISALIDRNWSYLYHPVAHVIDQPKWEETMDSILQHSRCYLEKMVAISCLQEFAPYQWSYPGIHQPLNTIMVLIRHVNRFPFSTHSDASRSVVDEALALCGPDGGLVGNDETHVNRRPLKEGGAEAWGLIRKLRAQAWRKAGVDPDILLTRAETTQRVRARLDTYILEQWPVAPEFDVQSQMGLLGDEELMGMLDPAAFLDQEMDWSRWG